MQIRMRLLALLPAAVIAAAACPSAAADLNPPEWRDATQTCRAAWTFDSRLVPDPADEWDGPSFGAQATANGWWSASGGVWQAYSIDFELGNYPHASGETWLWIQLAWSGG